MAQNSRRLLLDAFEKLAMTGAEWGVKMLRAIRLFAQYNCVI